MNTRIEKLISEAVKAIPDHVDFDLPKEFTEKFAELIVQECVRKVRNRGGMCGALASNWIEEHFYGVEE